MSVVCGHRPFYDLDLAIYVELLIFSFFSCRLLLLKCACNDICAFINYLPSHKHSKCYKKQCLSFCLF